MLCRGNLLCVKCGNIFYRMGHHQKGESCIQQDGPQGYLQIDSNVWEKEQESI